MPEFMAVDLKKEQGGEVEVNLKTTKEQLEALINHKFIKQIAGTGLWLRMKGFVQDTNGKFWQVQGVRGTFDKLVEVPATIKKVTGEEVPRTANLVVIGRYLKQDKVDKFVKTALFGSRA